MEWHEVVNAVKPYVFKVETPRGFGTGFLFAYAADKNVCGLATAAHVVEYADKWDEPIEITHFESGKSVRLLPGPARVRPGFRIVNVEKALDTAALVFLKGDMELPGELLPLIDPKRHLKVGVELGWVGFPALSPDDLCFFSGRVSSWVEEREAYLVDGVAINGVSGGPAFHYAEGEKSVRIVGVISAYAPNRATGESLPGLLVVRDITQLHGVIEKIRSVEEAIQKNAESKKSASAQRKRAQ